MILYSPYTLAYVKTTCYIHLYIIISSDTRKQAWCNHSEPFILIYLSYSIWNTNTNLYEI